MAGLRLCDAVGEVRGCFLVGGKCSLVEALVGGQAKINFEAQTGALGRPEDLRVHPK